ncbi:MAG TPA: transporter substrate-binding domain-containing protein [Pseudonocardiaceae bacterium]|jgi:polar amino acid transport system substrate-binding protein|nr:transporter substrate-binding domain-containing protein [Pseudonocardiaceae bacterium]
MSTGWKRLSKVVGIASVLATVVGGVAACGTSAASTPTRAANGDTIVTVAANATAATAVQLTVPQVAAIRAELPKSIVAGGKLVIGVGALPAGFPPLAYIGADQQTLTGSEPDLGRLVAAVFGLTPDVQNASWENLFVRLQSGQFNVGFSNITDTELRKQQGFDFASYRQDNLGFEVLKSSTWNFDGNYENLAGRTVAVGSGTNQEKILLQWQSELKAQGKTLNVRYFNDDNSTYLALDSGRIDAYFQPNPAIAYHVAQDAKTRTRRAAPASTPGQGHRFRG